MLDLVEERMIFMKQQDLVLQLMRNSSLYFVHQRKRPPREQTARVVLLSVETRSRPQQPTGQALLLLQGVTESSPGYHRRCGIYGYTTVRSSYRSHLETVERVGESMWQAARTCTVRFWIQFWFLLFKVCVAVRVAAVTRFFYGFPVGTSLRRLVRRQGFGEI